MNIETKLTPGKGLIQVKNLTGEAIERAVNLTKEAIGSGPEFMTGGVTCQNHYFWRINLGIVYVVRGEARSRN